MSTGNMGLANILADTTTIGDGQSIAAYAASAAGGYLTSTTIGSDEALDVNLTGLAFNEDTAATSGTSGIQIFAVRQDTLGSLVDADGDRSMLSVDATGNLYTTAIVTSSALPTGAATETTLASVLTEIQSTNYAEDTAHTTADPGIFALAIRNDSAATSLTSTNGDYSGIAVDEFGKIFTSTTISSLSGQYAEDTVAGDGDLGNFSLTVRRDTSGSNASASGDYAEFQSWSEGSLRTVDVANNINLQQVISVGTTALQLPAANLATRKLLMVQNVSNKTIYVGSSTVTADETATGGIQLGAGGFVTVEAGPDNDIYGIAGSAANPVAVWELS